MSDLGILVPIIALQTYFVSLDKKKLLTSIAEKFWHVIQNYQESEAQKFKTNRFSFVRKECNQSIFAVFKNLSVKTRVDGKVPLSKTA